jgi:hypothetical protein
MIAMPVKNPGAESGIYIMRGGVRKRVKFHNS